jgi:hypothetical protein
MTCTKDQIEEIEMEPNTNYNFSLFNNKEILLFKRKFMHNLFPSPLSFDKKIQNLIPLQ